MSCRGQCGNCVPMPTPVECVCCKEITAAANKCETAGSSEQIACITDHEGCYAVRLMFKTHTHR